MHPLLTALIVLAVLAAAAGFAYLVFLYSPAHQWKLRVLARAVELDLRKAAILGESGEFTREATRLTDEAIGRHLQTIPAIRLADYPNIGPATIDTIQKAGCANLRDALNLRFDAVPGIGPARAKALVAAVRAVRKDAQSRFDAGACPEAVELRGVLAALRESHRARIEAQSAELTAVESVIRQLAPRVALARQVTFQGFLFRQPIPGLSAELMAAPLPAPNVVPVPPNTRGLTPPGSPAPEPPAPPPIPVQVAAKQSAEPAVLPPVPPVPIPTQPTDLFRAALNGSAAAPASPAEHPELPRLRALVAFGMLMAKADGRVAASERKAIRGFLEQTFGHDPALVRHFDPVIERADKTATDEAALLAAVRSAVPPAERPRLYAWAERIADASGERNQKERDTLARAAAALELKEATPPPAPPRFGEGSQTQTPPSLLGKGAGGLGSSQPDPRVLLDIAPDVPLDPDLIRRRFALLTEKLDPTRAAALGPDFARMAEEKRTRIRAAAEALIAPFGEPLEKPAVAASSDLRHNPDLDDVFG